MAIFAKRGFEAIKEEEERRDKVRELKRGKLFRFYVPKGVTDVPITFLTEEPINFWEHSVPQGGNKFIQVPCIGDGCVHCEEGKPRFVSAWLVVDHSEYAYKDQSGAEKTAKDRIKLLVRGMTDAAILQNKSQKFGLMNYDWTVTKVGTGKSSSMQFERGDRFTRTPKQYESLMAQLPENLRELDPYDIVEKQIMGDLELDSVTPSASEVIGISDEEVEKKVLEGVQSLEDDSDEEEIPVRQSSKPKGKLPRKARE